MRCACKVCGAYMVHSESISLGCVCPECLNRCSDCLGTNTLISKEELKRLREDPSFEAQFGAGAFFIRPAGEDDADAPSGTERGEDMYSD